MLIPSTRLCGTHHHLVNSLWRRAFSTQKTSPPLRILFAGSDEFSAVSLRALHKEQQENPELIASLDVLCREDGKTGRKRNILKEVPIKPIATSLSLPLHIIPNFLDWTLPRDYDLIIAVSFGLFIPSSIINTLPYGGLNVHPSLLPRYRGAAPIQRTLLNHDPVAGVTIQTLDTRKFDHGKILLQEEIPVPEDVRYHAFHDHLANKGAEMLLEVLRKRLFVPPIQEVGGGYKASLAKKVGTEDEHIDWNMWDGQEARLRCEMLGSLWTELDGKRTILQGVQVLEKLPEEGQFTGSATRQELEGLSEGQFRWVKITQGEEKGREMMVSKMKNGWITVGSVKVEGKKEQLGGDWVRSMQGRGVGKIFK
ncbi:formyl transferase [Pyronema omphalodes]|nr:formyl transferase [Pyronema omphalodes]